MDLKLFKILAKAEEFGQYAFLDGPTSNDVTIAVDFCLSTDTSGQANINACTPGYSEVGIACYNPDLDADHVNTSKGVGGMFYCDLGSIGLMEKQGKKWKEIKYNLKKCVKKRAKGEKPANILLKAKGEDLKKNLQNFKISSSKEVPTLASGSILGQCWLYNVGPPIQIGCMVGLCPIIF